MIPKRLVFDLAGAIAYRRIVHLGRAVAAAHRCIHRSLNETATPFAWTKKKVYQRRFKNRRITQV